MNSFLRDISFGIRMLRKSPGFTLVAVISLAVGIGVNSTVFSFVNAIFFKPISISNSTGLVYVFAGDQRNRYRNTSYLNYIEFRKQNDVFSGLAAYAAPPMLMTTGEHTEAINSEVVSGNYFSVLDVSIHLGRPLTLEDEQISSTEPAVVVSDAFWRRRLNADPDILQRKLILNGNSFSVIGVAPANFAGLDSTVSTDVWIPITRWATIIRTTPPADNNATSDKNQANKTSRNESRLVSSENWLSMIGRLKPGTSFEQAQTALTTIASRLQTGNQAAEAKLEATLSPASAVHPEISEESPVALLILAVTSLILMICCVNVASLMLARAAARQKEFAVRIALGSSRGRLVRQLLTEAILLSLLGGILGFLLSYWTTRTVLRLIPTGDLGLSAGIAIDQRVLWFSFVISLLTALIFGLLPALNSFRADLVHSLAADSMSFGGVRRKINLRRTLVVVQIVASLVLLIGDGLFLRSFQKGLAIGENFRSDKILLLDLSPSQYGYAASYSATFYRELLNRVGAIPGVEAVTLANLIPLTMNRSTVNARIDGRNLESLQRAVISEGYFQTLRTPIVRGRDFDKSDDNSSRKVVIINEIMARTYWPGENPLGKTLHMSGAPHEIIGVVKDSAYNSFGKTSEPYLYAWLYQRLDDEKVSLIVRTATEPRTMIASVQREIKEKLEFAYRWELSSPTL